MRTPRKKRKSHQKTPGPPGGPTRRLIREAEARAAEAHVLKTVAEALNSAASLQEALDRSLEAVMPLIGSEVGWIILLDELGGTRLAAARNLPPALEADDRAAMRWHGCTCQFQLAAGKLTAAVNILECERIKFASGDTCGLRYHASAPLRVGSRVLGNLNLAAPADRIFTEDELRLLSAVGGQIGVAIERARLFTETQRNALRLSALYAIGRAMASLLEPREVCRLIVSEVATTLGYGAAAILLLDQEREELFEIAYYGYALQRPESRLKLGEGLSSRAVLTGRAHVTPDVTLEPAYVPGVPGCRSEADIPIRLREKVIGVLVVEDVRANAYSQEDVSLLTAVADQAAVAIENARLHEQVKAHHIEEQTTLLNLSQALLGETKSQAVMDMTMRVAAEALRVEFAAMALMDAEGASVSARASLGWPPDVLPRLQRVPLEAVPALAHAIRARAPVVISDEPHDTRFPIPPWIAQMGIASSLLAPMLVGEKAIGGLVVNSCSAREWSDDEVRLLSLIANNAAQALERAQLFAETQRQARQQTALFHLSASLAATLDEEEIYQRVAHGLHDILGYFQVALFLVDENTGQRVLRAVAGWRKTPLGKRIPPGRGLSERPLLDGQLHHTPDVRADPRYEPGPGLGAEVDVPLNVGGEIVGVLLVESERPHAFDENDFAVLTAAANLAGQALERARLYAHAQERLVRITALHEIDVAIVSRLSLAERLDVLLEKVAERLRVDAAAVALVNPETRELVYAARRGLDGEEFFVDGLLKVKEGIAGQIAHSGEPVAIPDVRAEPHFARRPIAERLGLVSYLAVPLRARGGIIGVLELATRERHAFPPEEIDFFATLAGQAAIAIDNARMFEEARRRATQEHSLAASAGAILATLDVDALWPAVLAGARQTLSANRVAIYLYDAAADRLTCPYASGLSAEYVAEINRRFREVPGGRLLSDPRPIAIADAQTDPAAAPVRDLAAREGFHSYAVFPLIAPGDPLGALVAYRDVVAPFTPDDIVTGQTLAHIVAVALQNARLFQTEREQRELAEALRDALGAGAALSAALDFDTVLDQLLEQIARVVPYDTANVMLLDAPTGRIRVARQRGYEQFGEPVVRDIAALSFDIAATANLRRMAETGQPLVISDTAAYPGWVEVEASAHVRSWAGAPIVVEGQVIAFFSLDKIEPNFYRPEHGGRLAAFAGQAALALQNARLFEAERAAREQAETLREAAQTVSSSLELDEVLHLILGQLKRMLVCDTASVLLFREGYRPALAAGIGYANERLTSQVSGDLLRNSPILSQMARDLQPVIIGEVRGHPGWIWAPGAEHVRSFLAVPIVAHDRMTGALMMDNVRPDFFSERDARLAQALAQHMGVAIENARLFDETRRRAGELGALAQVSSALRQAQTREAMLPLLVEKTMQLLHADAGALLLLEGDALVFAAARGPGEALVGQSHPPGGDPLWQVARTGEPMFIPDVAGRSDFTQWEICQALMAGQRACACLPLKTAEATVGLLHLASRSKWAATEDEMRLLTSIAEMAGNALHRAALHEQTAQRLQRLSILRAIDLAISASLDLHVTLNVFLDQVITQLRVDAADVLLLNPHTQTLEYAVGRGFRGSAAARTLARLGEGHAGRAALERRVVHVSNLSEIRIAGRRTQDLTAWEGFVTYYAVPLAAKGHVKGVLEIFHRTLLHPDPEWLDFLEALAVQAAIAIDNATLYKNLQRSNAELALAYDATIEGWSRALDLRDRETEGHTRRVTELTLRLARVMGVSDAELIHVRWGALLHDIGKMGIPDSVLLEPGPLIEEEWEIMRKHPQYAHDMLLPIAFLRPALDIPYCHHEKWDGTGYPRGLKGEQIPLAVRIFVVADVWDALRSDRPYRAAWPEDKVREYIREQAGKHFDPRVVEAFLKMAEGSDERSWRS